LLVVVTAYAQGPDEDETCLACHSNPDLEMTLPSGETLPLFVDAETMRGSVHAAADIGCTACHTDIEAYPHPPTTYADLRDVTIQNAETCSACHQDEADKEADSVHQAVLAAGNRNAPVCTDCHFAHTVDKPAIPRTAIQETCSQCHSEIADEYAASVHGTALSADNNPDVPTCVDCHNVHNIGDPTAAEFRLQSPQLCSECHTDSAIMSKYGLSTSVLDTYVADFHGSTVELFAKQHPDQATNKPVCYDCHGVHDIKSTEDPDSAVTTRENLLKTCQSCHPDATSESFTAAWMSHYEASPTTYPLVYYVNLFYWIVIPVTIGGLGVFVATDVFHRTRSRTHPSKEEREE
jgi:predicted CXXCH cytochrome family protein